MRACFRFGQHAYLLTETVLPSRHESDDLLRVLERGDDESSEEEERLRWWWQRRGVRQRGVENGEESQRDMQLGDGSDNQDQPMYHGETSGPNGHVAGVKRPREDGWGGACKAWASDAGKWRHRAQRTAWPHWVYRQFDAYDLARRAAGGFLLYLLAMCTLTYISSSSLGHFGSYSRINQEILRFYRLMFLFQPPRTR